jgi:hypothetical protein
MTFDEDWLVACLSRHDVEKLIDCGAPWDEYSPEAEAALPLLLKAMNAGMCLDILEQTWDLMFGNEHVDRKFLEPIAREVWQHLCACREEQRRARKS